MTLKVGYILDYEKADQSNFELIQWLDNQDVELTCIINQKNHKKSVPKIFKLLGKSKKRIIDRVLFKINKYIEFFTLSKRDKDLISRKKNVKSFFKKTIDVFPILSKSGNVYKYTDSQIDEIRSEKLDLLIRGSNGILKGDILKSSRFGIISFHHADNSVNRGCPAGFWEVYHRNPNTGFTIQKLTEELDGGEVLYRGSFLTKRFWLKNYSNLLEKSNYYMKTLIKQIIDQDKLPLEIASVPYTMPLFKVPTFINTINYQLKSILLIVELLAEKLLRINFRWSVRYQYKSWNNIVMWKSKEIKNPKGSFLADPFHFHKDGKDYIFVEEYIYSKRKGHISIYQIDNEISIFLGRVLEEEFHLSYPMIFEFNKNLYMIPETSKTKSIRLYRCTEFPLKWKFEKTIMENVDAADTTIFRRKDKWWMLVNIDPVNRGDHCSELFAFWSEDPISCEWKPHKKNPLLIDPSKARMGGIIFDKKSIFRVAQKQGFNIYGMNSQIFKINELSEEVYIEEEICINKAKFSRNIIGTHHMHCFSDLTVFDCLRKRKTYD